MDLETLEEISVIRERLVRIETLLEHMQQNIEKAPSTGNIVIPVTAVVAALEILKALLEHFPLSF